jgi:hypothetical protein
MRGLVGQAIVLAVPLLVQLLRAVGWVKAPKGA